MDRNPQTFVNIPTARPEDLQKATHRLHRGGKVASALTVRVEGKSRDAGLAQNPVDPQIGALLPSAPMNLPITLSVVRVVVVD